MPDEISREWGKRLYVSPKKYQDQIRLHTDKAFDNTRKLPHSENKRPYWDDSYEEMEYFRTGVPWDFPYWDFPWLSKGGGSEPMTPPWLLVFTCQLTETLCFCDNGTEKCADINCSHKIVEASVETLGDPGAASFYDVSASGGRLCVTGKPGGSAAVRVNILMVADPGDGSLIYGEYGPILITQCDDEDCGCSEGSPDMSWDVGSSATTINRSGTAAVEIDGGTAPYSWSVSGTGLSMTSASTSVKTNTVEADGTACGCGVITVTDACGKTATGNVRVVEASGWTGYGDSEQTDFCASNTWGASDSNILCDDICWRLDWSKRGGWASPGSCPGGCLCANYFFTHSNGHGCSFNCTWQVDARSLGQCAMNVAEYKCS